MKFWTALFWMELSGMFSICRSKCVREMPQFVSLVSNTFIFVRKIESLSKELNLHTLSIQLLSAYKLLSIILL